MKKLLPLSHKNVLFSLFKGILVNDDNFSVEINSVIHFLKN